MAAKAATWIAFGCVVKRGLTTITPTRTRPRPLTFLPPHQTIVSKAAKGRKLPKHHFTSNTSHRDEHNHEGKKKAPKRKAARTQAASNSLRRVAVEAQRSRGSLIKGKGKMRHVDPEAETKDVTAYCAAETYNVHVARSLLVKEGYEPDPFHTALFPQVLHVQTPSHSLKDEGSGKNEEQGPGDVFVFPSGSVVTWNVSEKQANHLVQRILLRAAENSHPDKLEAEDLDYLEDPTRESSMIVGDTIILGTKLSEEDALAESQSQKQHEVDTILAKIAFSSALARSTKLAVLENSLSHYFSTIQTIPSTLSAGRKLRFTRAFILRKTGELLNIRAQLNLYSELTDSLPDIFWDSPHELGLENYYEQVGQVLDVGVRIKALNEKMDYASEINSVLRERLSEKHSHLLEWIIIWLILIEVAYGSLHLWRERRERLEGASTTNLLREYLVRELGRKEGKGREG